MVMIWTMVLFHGNNRKYVEVLSRLPSLAEIPRRTPSPASQRREAERYPLVQLQRLYAPASRGGGSSTSCSFVCAPVIQGGGRKEVSVYSSG